MGLLGPGRPSMVEGGLPRGGGGGESPSPATAVDEARRARGGGGESGASYKSDKNRAELSCASAARMPSMPSRPWPTGSAASRTSTPPCAGPVYRQKTTCHPGPDDINYSIVVHGISFLPLSPWPPTRS